MFLCGLYLVEFLANHARSIVLTRKTSGLDVFLSRTLRQALAAGEVFGSLWETCVSLFGPGNLDVFSRQIWNVGGGDGKCGVSCNVNIKMMGGKLVNLDFLGLFLIIDGKDLEDS